MTKIHRRASIGALLAGVALMAASAPGRSAQQTPEPSSVETLAARTGDPSGARCRPFKRSRDTERTGQALRDSGAAVRRTGARPGLQGSVRAARAEERAGRCGRQRPRRASRPAARPHVVMSAHLDTVFPEGTDGRDDAVRADDHRAGDRRRLPRARGVARRGSRPERRQRRDATAA